MSRKIYCWFVFAMSVALIAAGGATAQQPPGSSAPQKNVSFYRLDLVLRELDDGKLINTRSYFMLLKADGASASLRAGNEIPISVISFQEKPAGTNYRNIGFSIDCALEEIDGTPAITLSAGIDSVLPPEQIDVPKSTLPGFRHLTFKSAATLSPGKPTMVSSIDDPNSKRRFQLEITATKHK
jgi:hypothetical protein